MNNIGPSSLSLTSVNTVSILKQPRWMVYGRLVDPGREFLVQRCEFSVLPSEEVEEATSLGCETLEDAKLSEQMSKCLKNIEKL